MAGWTGVLVLFCRTARLRRVPLKITVWGINYTPECTGIAPCNTALCEFLRARGHDVCMVTTFSYYPSWRKRSGDRLRLFRTDDINGVRVHRCWHYVPRQATILKRILHESTFVVTSLLRQVTLSRAEVYVVVSPPLLLGLAAWCVGRLKRAPVIFHVQDLQPDAAASLGMLPPRGLMRFLYRLEAFAYAKADRVSGISLTMVEAFRQKGVPAEKLVYFPNGVGLPDPARLPAPGSFRRKHGFSEMDFLVLYSGNLGVKQGLDVLIEAARGIENSRLRLVICGDGNQREHLAALIARDRLANVQMLPLQSEDAYRQMLIDADLLVIPQQSGSSRFFFPSKLLPALAYGKPIVTVADPESELVRALQTHRFGFNVSPGQPRMLAETWVKLAGQPALLKEAGSAGRRFVEKFEIGRVLGDFEAVLREVVKTQFRDDR
jgi:colanic acid biosynthesis glycosyl transferase WcaI